MFNVEDHDNENQILPITEGQKMKLSEKQISRVQIFITYIWIAHNHYRGEEKPSFAAEIRKLFFRYVLESY